MAPSPIGSAATMVLLVDDEAGIRELAARMLREAGFEVRTANDGAEALVHVLEAEPPFDVVVTDLKMPRMDGETLAREIAAHDPACRFVFVSGYPGPGSLPGPLLRKPFRADELVSAVLGVAGEARPVRPTARTGSS